MATKKSNSKPAKSESAPSSSVTPAKRFFNPVILISSVMVIALGIFLIGNSRNLFIAAVVNGQPISRAQLNLELARQTGKQVLNAVITDVLILQEAKKQGITVSDSEINEEIKNIEDNFAKQGTKLQDVMKEQGVTMNTLKDKVKVQKLVEKMVGKGITVTDKEVDDYITANKAQIKGDINKDQIKKGLLQQKINAKIPAWIGELQKKAKITPYI